MNIAIVGLAASLILAPAPIDELTAPSHELAMIQCLSTPDDDYQNCVDAVNNTDWAPMSTLFVTRTLINDDEIALAVHDTDRELRDAATAFDTTYEYERDILVCELSFPTFYPDDSDMYLTDPNAFALDACISDTISNHQMTE
jgi:hypothetical protein